MTPGEEKLDLVNEPFWLAQGAQLVRGTAEKLDSGAQRITTALGWYWAAYSGAVAAGVVVFHELVDPLTMVFAVAPVLLLFLAYAVATWAGMPMDVSFHANEPASIQAAWNKAISRKRRRLGWSLFLATAATLFVGAAFVRAQLRSFRQHITVECARSATKPSVLIEVRLPEVGSVQVEVVDAHGHEVQRVLTLDRGLASATLPVDTAQWYDVSVTWRAADQAHRIEQRVKP